MNHSNHSHIGILLPILYLLHCYFNLSQVILFCIFPFPVLISNYVTANTTRNVLLNSFRCKRRYTVVKIPCVLGCDRNQGACIFTLQKLPPDGYTMYMLGKKIRVTVYYRLFKHYFFNFKKPYEMKPSSIMISINFWMIKEACFDTVKLPLPAVAEY